MVVLKLSIIIPTNKDSKNLQTIIDNFTNINSKEMELLVVGNNGFYPNYKNVINITVGDDILGVNGAREFGLKQAKGKYVLFMDSDDMVDWMVIKANLVNLKNNDAYLFNHKRDGKLIKNSLDVKSNLVFWNKIIKRDLFQDFKFLNVKIGQDMATIPFVLSGASLEKIESSFYNYITNEGSISRTFSLEKINSLIEAINLVIKRFSSTNSDIVSFHCKTQLPYAFIKTIYINDKNERINARKLVGREIKKHGSTFKFRLSCLFVKIMPRKISKLVFKRWF